MTLDSMTFDGTNVYFNYTVGVEDSLSDMQLKVRNFLFCCYTSLCGLFLV